MQVPGVSGVRSMVCLEEIKPASPLPLDRAVKTTRKPPHADVPAEPVTIRKATLEKQS